MSYVFFVQDNIFIESHKKARLHFKKKIQKRLFSNSSMCYYGSSQIPENMSDIAYSLMLPECWRIHNAFHMSFLLPFVTMYGRICYLRNNSKSTDWILNSCSRTDSTRKKNEGGNY